MASEAAINLYGQTYEQIVTQVLGGKSENFQLVNPMEDWTWAPASQGFIDAQAYRFVGQTPVWSAVGKYTPGGSDMHQAYLQVLSLWNALGKGLNEDQVRQANEEVTRARNQLGADSQQANEGYISYKNSLPVGIPVKTYDDWIAEHWKGTLDADKLVLDKALQTLGLIIGQKNPGLKAAIDAATAPESPSTPKPGFVKVQIGTTIGVRPFYNFQDPKVWADRVEAQGGQSLRIELSASAQSSALSKSWAGGDTAGEGYIEGVYFAFQGSGGWERMDLATEDKSVKVSIVLRAYTLSEASADTSWFNSGILRRMAVEDNWNPPFTTKGTGDSKPVFGKGGVLPLIVTGLIVGYQPTIDIEMSDATYKKYSEKWNAAAGIQIGPFKIGGKGGQEKEKWSKNSDNQKFHVESKATYPFIMGITVAMPGA